MAYKRRDQLTTSPEWWKHLRKFNKRRFWKRERRAYRLRVTTAAASRCLRSQKALASSRLIGKSL